MLDLLIKALSDLFSMFSSSVEQAKVETEDSLIRRRIKQKAMHRIKLKEQDEEIAMLFKLHGIEEIK